MQVPNPQKRKQIADTAAKMFAALPFHKVRLDDIAAAAGVGKGTLYVYFDNKEDLYSSLVCDAFARMVESLSAQVGDESRPAPECIERIVGELVGFAFQHPQLMELTRTAGFGKGRSLAAWHDKRRELSDLIERTIRRGVNAGELADPHPELTALCIPGLVRSVMLFGPKRLDKNTVTAHMMRLLGRGIVARKAKATSRAIE